MNALADLRQQSPSNGTSRMPRVKRRRSFSPLSPVGLALFSYALFFAATWIPPGTYQSIMQEHDHMFLDLKAHFFVLSCLLCFLAGSALASRIRLGGGQMQRPTPGNAIYVAVPVVLACLLNLASVLIFMRSNPHLLTAWLSDAKSAKRDFDGTGGLTEALPLLFGVCWWATLRLLELESSRGARCSRLRLAIGASFAFAVFTALVKVARYDLMPGIFGLVLVVFFNKYKDSNVSLRAYMAPLLKIGLGMVAVFILFGWLRGNSGISAVLNNVMGYTVASYNRLSMLLNGKIHFAYAGTGTYAFRFLGNMPLVGRWFDLARTMGMPNPEDAWLSEFSAVFRAGLDGRYIWLSAFGYIYADIGLFVFPYVFAVGAFAAWLWKSLQRGRATGVVLYPWFAFSIVFWFGSNYLAYPRLLTLAGTGVLLLIYDRVARTFFGTRPSGAHITR